MEFEPNGFLEYINAGTTFYGPKKLSITSDQILEGLARFNSLPEKERRLSVKYGKHDRGTDAAGWITGLVGIPQDKPQKVMATVEWNAHGKSAIKDKRQLFFSPEFAPNANHIYSGERGFTFTGGALVNDPHLTAMDAVVALSGSESNEVFSGPCVQLDSSAACRVALASDGVITMEVREKMCTMLGLDASASDDEMIGKIAELQKAKSDSEAEVEVKLSAFTAKDAEVVALTAAIAEKDKTLGELEIQLTAANDAAAAAASEKLDIEAAQAVEALIAQGKAMPKERAILLSVYKKDPADAKAQWELRSPVIQLAAVTGITSPDGVDQDTIALSAYDKAIANGATPAEAFALAAQSKGQ